MAGAFGAGVRMAALIVQKQPFGIIPKIGISLATGAVSAKSFQLIARSNPSSISSKSVTFNVDKAINNDIL